MSAVGCEVKPYNDSDTLSWIVCTDSDERQTYYDYWENVDCSEGNTCSYGMNGFKYLITFTPDYKNKLSQRTVYPDGSVYEEKYEYNSNGKVIKGNTTKKNIAGDTFFSSEYTYEYDESGNKLKYKYTDKNNKGDITLKEKKYLNGKVIEEIYRYTDSDGTVISSKDNTFEYDKNGKMIKSVYYNSSKKGSEKGENTYSSGRIVSERYTKSSEKNSIKRDNSFEYDKKGRKEKATYNTEDKNGIISEQYTYYNGREISGIKIMTDKSGNIKTQIYEYDINGKRNKIITKTTYSDADGNALNGTFKWGRDTYFVKNGKQIGSQYAYESKCYSRDADKKCQRGNYIEKYNKNGNIISKIINNYETGESFYLQYIYENKKLSEVVSNSFKKFGTDFGPTVKFTCIGEPEACDAFNSLRKVDFASRHFDYKAKCEGEEFYWNGKGCELKSKGIKCYGSNLKPVKDGCVHISYDVKEADEIAKDNNNKLLLRFK